MAQNITLWGASYSDVPSVILPKTGGGTASFTDVTDTTAAASDVATGKYFYTSAGVKTAGTNSGGGGSNIVQGTFTTGATRNTTGTVTLNYSGSGYPIACFVYINGGPYNNGTGGNTTWYNSVNRYDCGWYAMTKARTTTAPTYKTSGMDNAGTVALIYKNSTSNSTTYTRISGMSIYTYTSSSTNPTNNTGMVRFKGNGTTLAYYIGDLTGSTVGFPPSTEMAYIVIYSS